MASTLAYVRTEDGVVQVDRGGEVPAQADAEHVAVLAERKVLVTAAELKRLDRADADAAAKS